MKTLFTLTPAESKRLIAKAVVQMEEVREALSEAYLLVGDGASMGYISEELTGDGHIPFACNTMGLSTNRVLCVSNPATREFYPGVYRKGEPVADMTYMEALTDYHPKTVVIKGANAVDTDGMVGVFIGGFTVGMVTEVLGPVISKGLTMITPVGLETLVPSVREAAKALGGGDTIDISIGTNGGMICLSHTKIVTEIQALKILFDLDAHMVCGGGIGGNEGAVTLVAEGEETNVKEAVDFIVSKIKGEPRVKGNKGLCEDCRYTGCVYNRMTKYELPDWMDEE